MYVLQQYMKQNLNIKKSELQRLIETYLKRSGPEDIYFMQKHIKSTNHLASSVNSHLQMGLSLANVLENQELYGSNVKKVTQDYKLFQLLKIVKSQLFKIKCALLLITIFMQFICGFIWDSSQMKKTSIYIEVLICFSIICKIYLRWRSFNIICKENYGKKPSKVYVYRDGEKLQTTDNFIKVGDILFIDFNETIPVSGILITPLEITVDQSFIGRGIQNKLNLQHCLQQIENKNQLQLKIEYENGALPSPVLIRGSKAVHGGTFKMLVISTGQSSIIQKYDKSLGEKLGQKSILQQWISTISIDLQHISQICFIIVLIFHTIAMIFKVVGLPSNNYYYLMQNIIDQLYTIIAASFLLDANILMDLLKGEYINVLNLVERVQQLDKLLSVEQIIISDQNICKYDQIQPKKIVLCDIYEPVDIKLLPAMQETIHYNILYEILGGVQLDSSLPVKIQNKYHKNAIVHVNNSQQKIYSSLYENCHSANASLPHLQEDDSVSELIKNSKHLHQSQARNKVNPNKSNISILSGSVSHQCSLMHDTNKSKKTYKGDKLEVQMDDKQRSDKLDEYLNKQCPFSTQNIINGLSKLAKNQSRTYYFQKFSIERLSKSKYIWNHGKFTLIKTQDQDRLLIGVKKLQRQNLTVYLIGIDQGAFSNQYMSYLFGAIGVQINQQETIIQKLKRLQNIGISSLITIFKNNFDEMNELQCHQYQYDFLKRGWMNENQHFCKLQQIKRIGGRKICRACLLTKCQCRPKDPELSNIQGFLMAIQNVKCIYNIAEEDIQYIQLGFQQLNVTTLKIIDRKEDTIGRLNQIIIGHQLINKLQQNLSFWILNLLIIFFCCLPINYMTFGSIFCYEQLYFYFLYIQLLIARNHFSQNSEEAVHQQKGDNRRSKNLFGWDIKGDILIFLFLLICSCITMIYFPNLFVKQDHQQYFNQYSCTVSKSFYHNPHIKTHICKNGIRTVILYPKLSTFIFLVTMFAITLKTFFSTQRIFTVINIVCHVSLVGILMIFAYLCPSLLHLCHDGLNPFEFSLVISIAVSIAFLSKLNGWIIGNLQGGKRFQLILDLSIGKKYNEYAQILKQYKQQKTLKYPYEQQ